MNKYIYYIKKIRQMSLHDFFYTICLIYIKPNTRRVYGKLHRFLSTSRLETHEKLQPLFSDIDFQLSKSEKKNLGYVCEKYCAHNFDILGSGWIKNSFGSNSSGFMGVKYPELSLERDGRNDWIKQLLPRAELNNAGKIYSHIDSSYVPIDWQKDVKSGWRWSAKTWYLDVRYGDKTGVDVKVPWELSRLQHLVRMAVSYTAGILNKEQLLQEFTDQVMDFIAQNPPERGINWRCTMDVGIRTANLALSYSIFKAGGAIFDDFFEQLLAASIHSHCRFIRKNLEWSSSCRSNHYLSDICGLLFGAAVLPDSNVKKKWLSFARREIEKELFLQFHEDGSDFEASVAYHRLSSEMIVYSAALINRLAEAGYVQPLSLGCFSRIYKMGIFAHDTVRPDGTLYQCGDNDSGRFFNVTPVGIFCTVSQIKGKYESLKNYNGLPDDETYFDENVNCVDGLLSAINGLLGSEIPLSNPVSLESDIIRSLSPKSCGTTADKELPSYNDTSTAGAGYAGKELPYKNVHTIPVHDCDLSTLHHTVYPDFGLTIYRSNDIYLAICWSNNGQNGNAGHTHNDKLSFELWLKGIPYFQDPGTFVYTPFPEWRNRLRSVKSHSAPISVTEQNEYLSLFSMTDSARCRLLELSDYACSALLEFGDTVQKRTFSISQDAITILDESNRPFQTNFEQEYVTCGYGKLMKKEYAK